MSRHNDDITLQQILWNIVTADFPPLARRLNALLLDM